jgi:hypothetical protein
MQTALSMSQVFPQMDFHKGQRRNLFLAVGQVAVVEHLLSTVFSTMSTL